MQRLDWAWLGRTCPGHGWYLAFQTTVSLAMPPSAAKDTQQAQALGYTASPNRLSGITTSHVGVLSPHMYHICL